MTTFFLALIWCSFQETVPYKASDEFKIEMEYKFRERAGASSNTIHLESDDATPKRVYAAGSLPYLVVALRLIKLSDREARLKIIKGDEGTLMSKKAEQNVLYKIDLGFTDDMKDRVTPHEYLIYILTSKKEKVSLIRLFIMEDGTFLVNDEVRGKF